MTGLWTLWLLLMVTGVALGQDSCNGTLADTLGHPTDCSRYYNLYQMACPDGQLYNSVTRECGPPAESECGQTSTGTSTTTAGPSTTSTTPSTTTPTTTRNMSPAADHGQQSFLDLIQIPSTSHPDSDAWQLQSPPDSRLPSSLRWPIPCPEVDDPDTPIRWPHETDCHHFYTCLEGAPLLQQCDAADHFNPVTKACQSPEEAGCDRCPKTGIARLIYGNSCGFYYLCENGESTLYQCPLPLEFSRKERFCLPKDEADCSLTDLVGATEEPTTPTPSYYTCPEADSKIGRAVTRYAHDSDCRYYYQCIEGRAELFACFIADHHFDPVAKECVAKETAGCDRCPLQGVARLPHPTQCVYYVRCVDQVATVFSCPGEGEQEFSRAERVCMDRDLARCSLGGSR